jgi:hypothetical protein
VYKINQSKFYYGSMVYLFIMLLNKTDRHDITEILLKVVLSTMNKTPLSAKKTKQTKKNKNRKKHGH